MPAHKETKRPAGQIRHEVTLSDYITRKQDSFDRYPYLKSFKIVDPAAKPKLTFDEWLDVSVPVYGTRRETWLQAGFSLDHMKMIWNAAQENK
jgi:hypothetical protein